MGGDDNVVCIPGLVHDVCFEDTICFVFEGGDGGDLSNVVDCNFANFAMVVEWEGCGVVCYVEFAVVVRIRVVDLVVN